MPKLMDLLGQRFGELVVVGRSDVAERSRRKWICRCDCGATVSVKAYSLRCGDTTCCGAHRTKAFLAKHSKPNPSKRKYPQGADTKSRLWTVFRAMHLRCERPSHPAYERYGGRGITICQEWSHNFAAFSAWALASGYTDDLTLDRIDNDKGYEPANCRWATRAAQALNMRSNVIVTAFGETKPIKEWTRDPRCNATPFQCYKRIKAGHAPEFAMTATEREVRSMASKAREAAFRTRGYKNPGRPLKGAPKPPSP